MTSGGGVSIDFFGISGGTNILGWPGPRGLGWHSWDHRAPLTDSTIEIWRNGWQQTRVTRPMDLPNFIVLGGFWWRYLPELPPWH